LAKKSKKHTKSSQTSKKPVTSSAVTLSASLDRHRWWICLGLILLGALCSNWLFNPELSIKGDDAVYVVLGMSWAQGSGNSIICQPGEPANTMVPPGYPLLLAPFLALSSDSWVPLKLLSAVLFLLSLPLIFLIIRNRSGQTLLALGVAVLSAINLNLLDYSYRIMTEIPYLFFSLLGIWILGRALLAGANAMSRRNLIFLGGAILVLLFAYHVRSIGIVLPFALIFLLLLRKQYRLVLLTVLLTLLLILPWAIRNQTVGQGESYIAQFLLKNPYDPTLGGITAGGMLTRIISNIKTYGINIIPQALFPSHSPLISIQSLPGILLPLGVLATLLTILGFVHKVKKKITLLEIYTVLFLGICVLWPEVWSGMRFIVPVVPFVFYYFLVGVATLAGKLSSWSSPALGKSMISVIVILMVISSISGLNTASKRLHTYPPAWQNYFYAAQWCRDNTDQEDIFVARKPSLFYLRARRQVLRYPYTTDHEEMMTFMAENGVDYVIVGHLSGTTGRYLVPAVQANSDKFQVVHMVENPNTLVLQTIDLIPSGEGGQ